MQRFIGTRSTDCSICMDDYRDPRYLPCGHTFCTPCIQKLIDTLEPHYSIIILFVRRVGIFRCPNCRNIVEVPARGAEGFPRDVKVDEHMADIGELELSRRRADKLARRTAENLAETRAKQLTESKENEMAEMRARKVAQTKVNKLEKRMADQESKARRRLCTVSVMIVFAAIFFHWSKQCETCTTCPQCSTWQPCPICQRCQICKRCNCPVCHLSSGSDELRHCQVTVKHLKRKVDDLNDALKTTHDLALTKTYELEPAKSRAAAVMTLVDGKLLIANAINGELKLRDAYSVTKESNWTTVPSSTGAGMGICPKNGQVFVSTWNKYIYRFNSDGEMLSQWPVETSGTISVTNDCTVVLAARDHSMKILIYSSSGEKINEIRMEADIMKSRLIKAVPLSKGGFVVSYGEGDDTVHGIDIINANGEALNSYGGRKGSGNHQLNYPLDFAVDSFGNILVVDSGNKRILLLDSKLKLERELVSTNHGLQHPFGILLNECENRLYVADNEWDPASEKWTNGRIMEFKMK